MTALIGAAIWGLAVFAWVSVLILVRAARREHIGALTERAVVAVVIAIFGTVYSGVVANAEVARLFDTQSMVVLVRFGVIVLLLLPIYWTLLYLTGRLGDDGKGGA